MPSGPPVVDADDDRTAAQLRADADAAAARGDWRSAVIDRFRAVVRSLEERVVLDVRPGRTADEAAAVAGLRFPAEADALRRGARLFDDVCYGDAPAGPRTTPGCATWTGASAPCGPGARCGRRARRRRAGRRARRGRAVSAPAPTATPSAAPRVVVGDESTAATRVRSRWRRARWPLAVLGLIVLVALLAALPEPRTSSVHLAPDNPDDDGARALAQILEHEGVEVTYVRTAQRRSRRPRRAPRCS